MDTTTKKQVQCYLKRYISSAVLDALNSIDPDNSKYFDEAIELLNDFTLQLDIKFVPKKNEPAPKSTYFILTTTQSPLPFMLLEQNEPSNCLKWEVIN